MKNNIGHLKKKDFNPLKRLDILDLSENMISNIEYTSLKNLLNSKVLKLPQNNLDIVLSKALSALINLVELDLWK